MDGRRKSYERFVMPVFTVLAGGNLYFIRDLVETLRNTERSVIGIEAKMPSLEQGLARVYPLSGELDLVKLEVRELRDRMGSCGCTRHEGATQN